MLPPLRLRRLGWKLELHQERSRNWTVKAPEEEWKQRYNSHYERLCCHHSQSLYSKVHSMSYYRSCLHNISNKKRWKWFSSACVGEKKVGKRAGCVSSKILRCPFFFCVRMLPGVLISILCCGKEKETFAPKLKSEKRKLHSMQDPPCWGRCNINF